jgi:hypothetical protein
VENKDRGTQVVYMFRIRQLFADFIVVLGDGRGSSIVGDYVVIATMIRMTALSHTVGKPSELRYTKFTFGQSTDLRH